MPWYVCMCTQTYTYKINHVVRGKKRTLKLARGWRGSSDIKSTGFAIMRSRIQSQGSLSKPGVSAMPINSNPTVSRDMRIPGAYWLPA